MRDDPRVEIAHQMNMAELADRLSIPGLKRVAGELVGPCPGPGCGGTDRFSINPAKGVINCRRCGAKGDQIALVQLVLGLDFPAALEWVAGPRQELTPAERAELARRTEANRRAREAEAERHRRNAIQQARRIWSGAQPADESPVISYLMRRGIAPRGRLPRCFRFEPAARLVVPDEKRRGEFVKVHEGPTMLTAIQAPDGSLAGVHRTWIDLAQPKGKVIALHPFKAGEIVAAKKVYGSKKGSAIRLYTPRDASCLVMAEGIETTLSALVARAIEGAAFWAGVDLGNMAGARKLGPGLKYAGIPDLSDADAFVPPPWVRRLVFVQDGDSDPKLTRAKLLAGLRRAMALRPGLTASIVHPGDGVDMNDLLMGAQDVAPKEEA